MRNFTHERMIEQWAESVLDAYRHFTDADKCIPIPIVDIAEKIFRLRCDIVDFGNERDTIAGVLIPRYRRIVANSNCSPNRLAFTIAHEIAHWAVDCSMGGEDHPLNIISTIVSDNEKIREIIADQIAGALLLPKNLLLEVLYCEMVITSETIRDKSNLFGVSYDTLTKRIKFLQDELIANNIIIDWSSIYDERLNVGKMGFDNWPWYDGDGWKKRFCPWLPSSQIKLEAEDKLLLFGRFDQIDIRTIQQIRDAKRKVETLFVSIFDNSKSIETITDYPEVENVVVFSSTRDINQQITILESKLDAKFKVLTLTPESWSSKDLLAIDFDNNKNNWIEYVASESAYARTGLSRKGKKLSIPLKPQDAIQPQVVLHTRKDAQKFIKGKRKEGKVVVLATGCFDVFTVAHLHFLKQAKAAGDILVIGVENDNRVTLFKGLLRPVNSVSERLEILDSFDFVDFTFVIHGPSNFDLKPFYTQLYTTLAPNILAVSEKDSYLEDRRDEIEAANGELSIVQSYEQNISSTSILQKVIAQHPELPQVWHIAQPLLLNNNNEASTTPEQNRNTEKSHENSRYEQLSLPLHQKNRKENEK